MSLSSCCSKLMDAVRCDHPKCLALLLESGEDPNEEDPDEEDIWRCTPLSLANALCRHDCFEVLIRHGVCPRWNDYLEFTRESLYLMVDYGGDIPGYWDKCQISRSTKREFHTYYNHVEDIKEAIVTIRLIRHFRDSVWSMLPWEMVEQIIQCVWKSRKEHRNYTTVL